jgi:S1-C subfamily serine protease
VSSVERNGFLANCKVQTEDVIVSLNNVPIDRHGIFITEHYYHRRNIFDVFKLIPIGEVVALEVFRDGKRIKLQGTTSAFKHTKITTKPIIKERDFIMVWGMTIQVLTYEILEALNATNLYTFYQVLKKHNEQKERLIITHVERESAAYTQEWGPGEVISSINGKPVESLNALIKIINEKSDHYKVKTEEGTIGFFKPLSEKATLLNPTHFL